MNAGSIFNCINYLYFTTVFKVLLKLWYLKKSFPLNVSTYIKKNCVICRINFKTIQFRSIKQDCGFFDSLVMTTWGFIVLFALVLFMFEVFPLEDKHNIRTMIVSIIFRGKKLIRSLAV